MTIPAKSNDEIRRKYIARIRKLRWLGYFAMCSVHVIGIPGILQLKRVVEGRTFNIRVLKVVSFLAFFQWIWYASLACGVRYIGGEFVVSYEAVSDMARNLRGALALLILALMVAWWWLEWMIDKVSDLQPSEVKTP